MTNDKDLSEIFKKGQIPELEEEKLIVFQFNDQLGEFEELEIEEDVPLYELLDPDFVLLFVDHEYFRIWLWHGSNTTTRMKFIAAKIAPNIRDRFGIGYKITAVDNNENSNTTEEYEYAVALEYIQGQGLLPLVGVSGVLVVAVVIAFLLRGMHRQKYDQI